MAWYEVHHDDEIATETIFTLLAHKFCVVSTGFPSWGPIIRNFDVFFDVSLKKLDNLSYRRRFDALWRSYATSLYCEVESPHFLWYMILKLTKPTFRWETMRNIAH